jgi:ribonuclease Y
VILSSFNPIRREVAVKALEQLVQDGRIHPTRIEEVVQKAQDEMKGYIHDRGEAAAIEAGVVGLKPGLLQLLGRMHVRTSFAQNVLLHSVQVAHLSGIMASELGLDAGLARRAGLLHDIGKSIDREIEGTHVEIGVTLAKRFGEPTEVIDAIAHHHDPENGGHGLLEPGRRRGRGERGSPRGPARGPRDLHPAPAAAREHCRLLSGVEERVCRPGGPGGADHRPAGQVSDAKAAMLAREIAGRIEQDMEYPGQVQVTVVRESRSVEYAR